MQQLNVQIAPNLTNVVHAFTKAIRRQANHRLLVIGYDNGLEYLRAGQNVTKEIFFENWTILNEGKCSWGVIV